MKKISGDHLPSFLKSRRGWGSLFEMKRSEYPHLHQVEPTNACPYRCVMCPRGSRMTRKIGYMEMPVFCRIMDEVSSYPSPERGRKIELFHFGESLLHPDIVRMNAYAAAKGLNTVLSVNALELTPGLSAGLTDGGAGTILVSLDGDTPESFERIRGRRIDYDQAVRNVLSLSEHIRTTGAATVLEVRMILLKQNSDRVESFRAFWQERGVNVRIREFFPWGETDLACLGEYDKYPPFMPCPFSWQYLVVQWNGDVVVCCRDYNGQTVMGNVMETSLKEIWNNKNYARFRENMVNGTYDNTICPECMALYYTEE
ncbi:MAG: radical SAM/SPASM domain-containing protein [Pseudomonadota bacterium]